MCAYCMLNDAGLLCAVRISNGELHNLEGSKLCHIVHLEWNWTGHLRAM